MSNRIPLEEPRILYCIHCGNETPQCVVAAHPYTEVDKTEEGEPVFISNGAYYMTQCATCKEISLFLSMDYESPDKSISFSNAYLVYPAPRRLAHNMVPKQITKTYDEASKIKKISPSLFAVQIGKALEFLCKDQKAKGETLDKQIQFLSAKGIIPPTFSKMTNILRIFRNYGAHASDVDIGAWDANLIDDFFNAIVEYVYIAPYKVNTLVEKIKKGKKIEPVVVDLSDAKEKKTTGSK